jgi:predicted peptidase
MDHKDLALISDLALPFLLSLPRTAKPGADQGGQRPVLCFLHGYLEGVPTEIFAGLSAHGPLSPRSSPLAGGEFIVAAPQLPARGDLWRSYADAVCEIVGYVQATCNGDPRRTYLTGFSYGGNGVLDLALFAPSLWAALWPVDPTRVPAADPGLPVWLSSGAAARPSAPGFIERLQLTGAEAGLGDRVYLDEGLDHVGTASSAYGTDRIYRWLLARQRARD